MAIPRTVKNVGKTALRWLWEQGQRAGVDVTPRHFYSSIPDFRELRSSDYWRKPSSMVGVEGADVDQQLAFVEGCCPEPLRARMVRESIPEHGYRENGEPGFGPIEADFLYCFIASKRITKVVQIGAGVSTAVMLLAAREHGFPLEITCVDPYPTRYLVDAARSGAIRLVSEKAQVVPIETLTELGPEGLFFVDSTHTVRPGSEVNRIILEVLPRLAAGSHVHFHDITFPYDYSRHVLTGLFFGGESTLLHAFLVNNSRVTISASLSMLHYARPEELQRLLPNYQPQPGEDGLTMGEGHFPSSTYLRITG